MELTLVILRGTPGSGKSTAAEKHFVPKGFEHFENDMYFMHNGKYEFDQNETKAAAQWCYDSTAQALRNGKNVVVSNVFVTRKAIDKYKFLAKAMNAKFLVYRLSSNFKNVHDVSEKVLKSMKSAFQDYPNEKCITIK